MVVVHGGQLGQLMADSPMFQYCYPSLFQLPVEIKAEVWSWWFTVAREVWSVLPLSREPVAAFARVVTHRAKITVLWFVEAGGLPCVPCVVICSWLVSRSYAECRPLSASLFYAVIVCGRVVWC